MKRVGLLLLTVIGAAAVGCAAPASVEGVFAQQTFTLNSDAPLSKPTASGRDMVIILSEVDGETLRTVTLTVPHFEKVQLGEALPVFDGSAGPDDPRPVLEVTSGKLLVEERSDGAQIISSTDAIKGVSSSGTLTVDVRDAEEIAGSFTVDLNDGGFLEGSFVATPSL